MMRPRPRVLHLLSDWRWSDAAESVVNVCRNLRRLGFPVDLACQRAPAGALESLEIGARERRVETVLDFGLRGDSRNPFRAWADMHALTDYIDHEEVQILHVHAGYDHYVGSRAARKANNQPFIVRTNHTGAPLTGGLVTNHTIIGYTDAWVAPARSIVEADLARFSIPKMRGLVVEGDVDLARFQPRDTDAALRQGLGIEPGMTVAGIVAAPEIAEGCLERIVAGLSAAMRQEPSLRALAIARGTSEAYLREKALAHGISDKVLSCGANRDSYPDCLAAADWIIYCPGGAADICQPAREAMAAGKAVVAPRVGLLSELLEEGKCGVLVDDAEPALAQALVRLARHPDQARTLGAVAAERARERFAVERHVDAIAELYLKLVEEG